MKHTPSLGIRILVWLLMMIVIEKQGDAMVIGPVSFQPLPRNRLMTDNFLSGMRSTGGGGNSGRSKQERPLPVPRAADFVATSAPLRRVDSRGANTGRFDSDISFQTSQPIKPYSVYPSYGNGNFGTPFNARNNNNNNNINTNNINNNNNSPFKNLFGTEIGKPNAGLSTGFIGSNGNSRRPQDAIAPFSPNGRNTGAAMGQFDRETSVMNHPFSSIRLTPIQQITGISGQQNPSYSNAHSPSPNSKSNGGQFSAGNHPLFSVGNRAQSFQHVNPFEKPIQRDAFPLPDVNEPITLDLSEDEQKRVLFLKQNKKLPPSRNFVDTLRTDPSSKSNYRFFPVNKDKSLSLPALPALPSRNQNKDRNLLQSREEIAEKQIPSNNAWTYPSPIAGSSGERVDINSLGKDKPEVYPRSNEGDTAEGFNNKPYGSTSPQQSRPGFTDTTENDSPTIITSETQTKNQQIPPKVHSYKGGEDNSGDESNGNSITSLAANPKESSDVIYHESRNGVGNSPHNTHDGVGGKLLNDEGIPARDINLYDHERDQATQTPHNLGYDRNNQNYNGNDRHIDNNGNVFNKGIIETLQDASGSQLDNTQGGKDNKNRYYTPPVAGNSRQADDSERSRNEGFPKQGNYDVTVFTDEKITKVPNNNNNNNDDDDESNQGRITPTAVTGNDPAVKRVVERTIDSKGEKVVSTETRLPTDHIGFILTDDIYDDGGTTRSNINPTIPTRDLNNPRPHTHSSPDYNSNTINTNLLPTDSASLQFPKGTFSPKSQPLHNGPPSDNIVNQNAPNTNSKRNSPTNDIDINSLILKSMSQPTPNPDPKDGPLSNNVEESTISDSDGDKPAPDVGSGYLRWPYSRHFQHIPREAHTEGIKHSSDSNYLGSDDDIHVNDGLLHEPRNLGILTQPPQQEDIRDLYPDGNGVYSKQRHPEKTQYPRGETKYEPGISDQSDDSENEIDNHENTKPFGNDVYKYEEGEWAKQGLETAPLDRRDNFNGAALLNGRNFREKTGTNSDSNDVGPEVLSGEENQSSQNDGNINGMRPDLETDNFNINDDSLRLGIMREATVSTHDKQLVDTILKEEEGDEKEEADDDGNSNLGGNDWGEDGGGNKNKKTFSRETDDHEHINLDNLSEYLKETKENDQSYTHSDDNYVMNEIGDKNNDKGDEKVDGGVKVKGRTDENGIPNFNDYTYESFGKSGVPFLSEDSGQLSNSEDDDDDAFSVNTDPISSKFDLLNAGEGSVSVRKISNTFEDDDDDVDDDDDDEVGNWDFDGVDGSTGNGNASPDETPFSSEEFESGQNQNITKSFEEDGDAVVLEGGNGGDGELGGVGETLDASPDTGDSGDIEKQPEPEEVVENETSDNAPSDKFFKPESSYDRYDFATPSSDGFSAQSAFIQSDLESDSSPPSTSGGGFSSSFESLFGKSQNKPEAGSSSDSFRSLFQNINQDYLDSKNLGEKVKPKKGFSGVFDGRDSLFDRQLGQIVERRPSLRLFS